MKRLIILALLTTVSLVTKAQQPTCSDDDYRNFDFWIGAWQVTSVQNKKEYKSQSKISKILGGCVILEEYSTPSGFAGKSLNIFDKTSKKWHQTWTDNSGLLLQLDGSWNGKSMVMQGSGITSKGESVTHQISWTPDENGNVRQVWRQRKTDENQWLVLFDGTYTKATDHHF